MFAFFVNTRAGNFNHSSWKTMPYLYHRSHVVVADDLATQGATTSAVLALAKFAPKDVGLSPIRVIAYPGGILLVANESRENKVPCPLEPQTILCRVR